MITDLELAEDLLPDFKNITIVLVKMNQKCLPFKKVEKQ